MSIPAKLSLVRSPTSSWLPLKATDWPAERPLASARTSPIGNFRCFSTFSISAPTTPVAPTTATLKRRGGDPATCRVYPRLGEGVDPGLHALHLAEAELLGDQGRAVQLLGLHRPRLVAEIEGAGRVRKELDVEAQVHGLARGAVAAHLAHVAADDQG